jgi:hypothetical protein
MWQRLKRAHVWRRIFYERLTEPLHLNVISLFVAAFGSYRTKISFDLIPRQYHAYGVLRAADLARSMGVKAVSMVEFGVGEGTGLVNLCKISERVKAITGIDFAIVGFDTGVGMPPPQDYRDHPDLYQEGDFPMIDQGRLVKSLPSNARIIFGRLEDTVPAFAETLSSECPLGFVIVDSDYYSSARAALALLSHPDPTKYLPLPCVHVDNIIGETHNDWCGELLAVRDFNDSHPKRKLARDTFLRARRIFKHAIWLDQLFILHVLDHPHMQPQTAVLRPRKSELCGNPYFGTREFPRGWKTNA